MTVIETDLQRRKDPKQSRGQKTIRLILAAAAELLEEVGFERLSTNLVCKKAGLTPPALYRYFPNKYAIMTELGEELMESQNSGLRLLYGQSLDGADLEDTIYQSLKQQLELTEEITGGRWILRALHATPALCDVRTRSHDLIAEEVTKVLLEQFPGSQAEPLLQTMRLSIELGYSVIEYALDVPNANREAILRETAGLIAWNIKRVATA
ncbi:MAG: TetR/AcrR family transcriptional regulator [Mangrovicoccus sp.]|nr:TetR/AcrR family transcriptional regulator [Mangrovicoccus sp.]